LTILARPPFVNHPVDSCGARFVARQRLRVLRPWISWGQVKLIVHAYTRTGHARAHNQDRLLVTNFSGLRLHGNTLEPVTVEAAPRALLVVCDGLGGGPAGEVAAGLTVAGVEKIIQDVPRADSRSVRAGERLRRALEQVNAALFERSTEDEALRGMGTTCTAALIDGGVLYVAHVGDSRAYVARGDALERLTRDQTWAAELVEMGVLPPDEAAHSGYRGVLLQAIGVAPRAEVLAAAYELRPGDRLLLCSDGVHGFLDDPGIGAAILEARDPQVGAEALVSAATLAGSADDITIVLAHVAEAHRPPSML
jgi:protein phosphatase